MTKLNLFQKVWQNHTVSSLENGQTQLFVGRHLIHEVTSPQAFGMLREKGLPVRYPERTFATVDHIVPTDEVNEPYSDPLADAMIKELRKNCLETGVTFFDVGSGRQGIVHVVGPEQGLTQPGMTIACGIPTHRPMELLVQLHLEWAQAKSETFLQLKLLHFHLLRLGELRSMETSHQVYTQRM